MTKKVIIKSNGHGISLVLNAQCTFEELLVEVGHKMQEAKSFFKDAQLILQLQGRDLTDEEVEELIQAVETHSQIQILCVVPQQNELEDRFEKINRRIQENVETCKTEEIVSCDTCDTIEDNNKIFHGTLRSGQNLTATGSVIVVGDVNPGATVSAGEHVIVIGSLLGNIVAGSNGNMDAYVLALDMNPGQICINGIYGRSSDEPGFRKKSRIKKQFQIAKIENGCIAIENYKNNGGK